MPPMKLSYLGLIKNDTQPAVELCCHKDTSDIARLYRGQVEIFMSLFSKTIAERTKPGERKDVEEKNMMFHVYARTEGVAAVLISEIDYPTMVAHQLLSKVLDDFVTAYPRSTWQGTNPNIPYEASLKKLMDDAKDPEKASGIVKIQSELDQTKIVLHKTIENVLERGEKLDTLVAKSEGLTMQSKAFYQGAKSKNSCCLIM